MKKLRYKSLIAFLCLGMSGLVCAEIRVVVNTEVPDTALTAGQASNLFLGKSKSLPSGTKVVPVDQDAEESSTVEFYSKVVRKNPNQLKSYWSGLIFTGKGVPPETVLDDDEVIDYVSENPNGIGYVSGDADVSGVKVLLTIP